MSVLGIILAREGSKRLPSKNIKVLNGKPLIQYTIEAAEKLIPIVISTNDYQIAKMYSSYRLIRRPEKLCQDESSSEDAILHVMNNIEKHDYIMLLQPTSPLRTTQDIKNVLKIKDKCVVSIVKDKNGYKLNGAIYYCPWDKFLKDKKFIPNYFYEMPLERSIDIDTIKDFKKAEKIMKGVR